MDAETLKAAGKRLRKVRDESYDMDTFHHDFNEFIDLALKGELLPEIVVEKVGDVFINPIFNPEYAKPHEYLHSLGYPLEEPICVCGLREDDKKHSPTSRQESGG